MPLHKYISFSAYSVMYTYNP